MKSLKTVHRIPNTNIVIDYWKSSENEDKFAIRFMTVLRIKDHQVEYLRRNDYKIYTSSNNKELLEFYKIPTDRIVAIKQGSCIEISDEHAGYSFQVSTIESNYCAGSCMFLFQGPFGKIVYTGFFRPAKSCDPLQDPFLKPLIRNKLLDEVYIDNTYAAEHCQFPSRAYCIQEAVHIIKDNPNHKIIIVGNKFGKEEVLRDISMSLEENIGVSRSKYEELQYIMMPQAFKKFTPSQDKCRIIVEDEPLTLKECKRKQTEEGLCVIILLTAQYICEEKVRGTRVPRLSNLHILPYSSHASHHELMQFLYHLKARSIKPIILTESENTRIPQKMMEMCRTYEDSMPLQDSDFCFDTCTDKTVAENDRRSGCEATVQTPDISRQNSPNYTYTVDVAQTNSTVRRNNNNDLTDSDTISNIDSEGTYRDCEEINDVDPDVYHESESVAFVSLLETQDEYVDEGNSDTQHTADPLSMKYNINDSMETESSVVRSKLITESTVDGTQDSDISLVPDSNECVPDSNISCVPDSDISFVPDSNECVPDSNISCVPDSDISFVPDSNEVNAASCISYTNLPSCSKDHRATESNSVVTEADDESIREEQRRKVWKVLYHMWLTTEEEDLKETKLTKDTWDDLDWQDFFENN